VIAKLKFHTILDAGTGNGALTRLMRQYGKNAYGIELSRAALEKECPDLLSKNYVEAGILTNLPYEDNSFDLVMSSDVLEHIDPAEADAVVKELVRVSRRHLFLSISLKNNGAPKGEAEHTLLRPRVWWHKLFQKHGAVVNEEFLWAMQEKDSQYITENQKNCRQEGDESDGGLFEVCSVSNTWLVGKREQRNVRMHRSVTTENGELEPWFFAFRKKSFHGKNRTH
jgi:SAM-dependent methyltransferase